MVDIIIPGCTFASTKKSKEDKKGVGETDVTVETKINGDRIQSKANNNVEKVTADTSNEGDSESCDTIILSLSKFDHLFLVMRLGELDLKKLFGTMPHT